MAMRILCWLVVANILLCTHATKVTIIHTTDIHGWVAGHPHNSTLNGDFGDFHSLLIHMKKSAINNGEEFFLFDTGDLIEGTGLSDATTIHGQFIFDIIKNVSTYDALTIGNHDIGHPEVVTFMEQNFIPFWKGSYLTSNSLLLSDSEFIGSPFIVITSKLGTKVLVLGYLFNFTHEANNTVVVPVSVSLTQPYFTKAMQVPDVDLIVVAAHIAPQSPPELNQIYIAIRSYHKVTPLVILAGHSHVTYFQQLDPNAFSIESGKYFEVLGHIQFDLDNAGMHNLTTQWVDTSVDNFMALSGTTASTFPTQAGAETKALLSYYQQLLGLNIAYGCSPTTFWPEGSFLSNSSLYRLLVEDIIPKIVFNGSSSKNIQFFLTNSASLRYALFEGKVTRNDIYTISPFNDTYVYFKGIPGSSLMHLMAAIANTTGLARHGCAPRLRSMDPEPNWYYSSTPINSGGTYDLVTATYDALTILPVVEQLLPEYSAYIHYPTDYNGTGALQAFIEQFFPCTR